jgi:multicomponent Na+:H+ antiporter subunit D
MIDQLPALLVTVPLLCACGVALAGWLRRSLSYPLTVLALLVAAGSAVGMAFQVMSGGPILYKLGGWDPPIGIAYNIDYLNALVLVVVSVAAFLNVISAHKSIENEQQEKAPTFYALYILAVTGLLGMVVTGDAFNLYVLLEIASLSGYALVARGEDRAPLSTLNYLFLGTIGASLYLLGVGFLYMVTGTLNMIDIAERLPALYDSRVVLVAFLLIMVGVWLKAAFFPLHAWLPNAYTHANSAASSLLAPLMTKVMIYVMLRMMLTVFTPGFIFNQLTLNRGIVWLAVLAIVVGALMALAQRDLKRMLAYIIVSEVGYMVGGAWLGNAIGLTGAILHVLNDALMTLCAFMVVGNIVFKVKGYQFSDIKGLFAKMPFTMAAFVAGALSMIGVPPFCGFFSKWYLLQGALEAGHYGFLVALLFSSLVNVVLFFRVFEIMFFEGEIEHGHHHAHIGSSTAVIQEAPVSMVVPLWIVAMLLVLAGLYTSDIVTQFISRAVVGLG